MSKETLFRRVGSKLRNGSVIALQVAQGEMADIKAIEHHPAGIMAIVKEVREGMDILENYATEQKVSQGHRQENAEAYVTLAQSLANAATAIGSEGQNAKIILFADPDFIYEVLTEGQPDAIEQACRRMDAEQRKLLSKWLRGFDED